MKKLFKFLELRSRFHDAWQHWAQIFLAIVSPLNQNSCSDKSIILAIVSRHENKTILLPSLLTRLSLFLVTSIPIAIPL